MKGLPYVDGFIAVSEQTKQLWESYFPTLDPERVGVVKNELMYDLYDNTVESKRQKKNELLERLGVDNPDTKTVISYVGRIEEQKGYFVMEEVMRLLADDPNMVFIIGSDGTGDKARSFLKFITEDVKGKKLVEEGRIKVVTDLSKFGHAIKQKKPKNLEQKLEQLESQYQTLLDPRFASYPEGVHSIETEIPVQVASDIYIHPASTEAIGLSIQEAHIAKNYIIASKIGGIPQALDQHQDTLAHRVVDGGGETRIEIWEESFSEFAQREAGRNREVVIQGEKANFVDASSSGLITMLSQNQGKSFELDGVDYTIGTGILSAQKKTQNTKKGTELEAEFYVDEITQFRGRLRRGETKESVAPDQDLSASTREIYFEMMDAPTSIKVPIVVETKKRPIGKTKSNSAVKEINPRGELIGVEGFNKRSLGQIMLLFNRGSEVTEVDFEGIDVGIEVGVVIEIINRKINERKEKEAEINGWSTNPNEELIPVAA